MKANALNLLEAARYDDHAAVALGCMGGFALAAAYGLDDLIGRFSGCSMDSIAAATGDWGAWARTAVLGAQWLLILLIIAAALGWVISVIMLFFAGNEARRQSSIRMLGFSTAALTGLAISIPVFSQGICIAT